MSCHIHCEANNGVTWHIVLSISLLGKEIINNNQNPFSGKWEKCKLLGKCAIWRIGSRCRVAVLSTIRHFAFSVVFQTLGKELETQFDLYEFRKF